MYYMPVPRKFVVAIALRHDGLLTVNDERNGKHFSLRNGNVNERWLLNLLTSFIPLEETQIIPKKATGPLQISTEWPNFLAAVNPINLTPSFE